MELLLLIIALMTFVYLLLTGIEFVVGFNQIKRLTHPSCMGLDHLPKVTIILSVLNEENNIEQVITSLLDLDYPQFEVIAINDRSTDKTPEILEKLQQQHPHLHIYHIKELPKDWLGKSHALYFASQYAKGDWILFTDADVVMQKEALRQTMNYALENQLDHLTLHEQHYSKPVGLKILLLGQYITYSMVMKPWRIRYAWSKKSLGRGAFNLVKKEVYHTIKGHQSIAMECLDDLKLGELIKKKGYRQDVVNGQNLVYFHWYNSLKEMVIGLEKNSFAFHNYKLSSTFFNTMFGIIFFVWPFFSAIISTGWIQTLNIANMVLTFVISMYVASQFSVKKRYAIFYPVAIAILLYTILYSAIKTYKNKGVIWRGTHYSLKDLRRNRATLN